MADSYTQLYVHLVWATFDRQPLIIPEIEADVYGSIKATCERLKATVIAIGGIDNHIHLLVRFPTTVTIHQLAGQVKGSASHLVTHLMGHSHFRWQGGYGAFTLHKSLLPRVIAYIENQKEHHQTGKLMTSLERYTDYR